jgi:hypothetical protein
MWALLVLALGGIGAFAATQGARVEAADHNDPPDRVKPGTATTPDRASDIADVFVWANGTGSTQTTVFAMSFDGPNAHGAHALTCDPDVLYQFHITADDGTCAAMVNDMGFPDSAGTNTCGTPSAAHPCGQVTVGTATIDCHPGFSDMHTINVRFAPIGSVGCGVQAEFVGTDGATPISANALRGMTEANITSTITSGTVSLYAGLRDDAFFFDLAGFQSALATGHIAPSTAHPNDGFTGADFFANMNTPVIVIEVPTAAIVQATHALPPNSHAFRVWGSTARFH